jgi:hypothetical protein
MKEGIRMCIIFGRCLTPVNERRNPHVHHFWAMPHHQVKRNQVASLIGGFMGNRFLENVLPGSASFVSAVSLVVIQLWFPIAQQEINLGVQEDETASLGRFRIREPELIRPRIPHSGGVPDGFIDLGEDEFSNAARALLEDLLIRNDLSHPRDRVLGLEQVEVAEGQHGRADIVNVAIRQSIGLGGDAGAVKVALAR